MKNLFTVIDYGKENNDKYNTYDLWDENNNIKTKEVKISSEYILSTGDAIIIIDVENINAIVFQLEVVKIINNWK